MKHLIPIPSLALLIITAFMAVLTAFTLLPRRIDPTTVPDPGLLAGTEWKADKDPGKTILREIGYEINAITFSPQGSYLVLQSDGKRDRRLFLEGNELKNHSDDSGLILSYTATPVETLTLSGKSSNRRIYFIRK